MRKCLQRKIYWQRKGEQGFTLVETLLAIAILSMAVLGPLGIASSGISAATIGKDRLIAVALGQDVFEYVRGVRDANRLLNVDGNPSNDVPWLSGISLCTAPLGCKVDTTAASNNIVKINSNTSEGLLKFDKNVTKLYGYNGSWGDSAFTRWFTVEELVANREARIIVTVTWRTLFSTKNVIVSGNLMNW